MVVVVAAAFSSSPQWSQGARGKDDVASPTYRNGEFGVAFYFSGRRAAKFGLTDVQIEAFSGQGCIIAGKQGYIIAGPQLPKLKPKPRPKSEPKSLGARRPTRKR